MKKILVVDDEESFRNLIVFALETRGFETLVADNGQDALDLAGEHHPDLIVSDVMMDNINGFVLRDLIRGQADTAAIPIVLISGQAQTSELWGNDPGTAYLLKPFTVVQLLEAVERMLAPARTP